MFPLYVLLYFASSSVFGIDFGSKNLKIGLAQLGKGVNVVLDQYNQRLIPTYFAFWNTSDPKANLRKKHWSTADIRACSWLFAEDAKDYYYNKYPKNVFAGILPFYEDHNGLTRREYIAILLHHLFNTIDQGQHNPSSAQVVVAVDPDMTRKDRWAIHEIIKMAGGTLKSIVDAPAAAAHLYAVEKLSLFKDRPKIVSFVNVGSSRAWVSIYRFIYTETDPIVEQLSIATNDMISGDIIDQKLFLYIKKLIFNEGITLTEKEENKLLFSVIKAKEQLTLNNIATISIDEIKTFKYTIKRDEFEKLFTIEQEILGKLYMDAISKAKISRLEIDAVELLGGSSRVPFIVNEIHEQSLLNKLNKTMNSDEAIALGAAYIGANQSSNLVTKRSVNLKSFCRCNVTLIHNGKSVSLFNESNWLDDTASYDYNVSENSNISLYISDSSSLIPYEMVKFFIKVPVTAKKHVHIHLDFGFDEMTLPGIFNIRLNRMKYENIEFFNPSWTLSKREFNRSIAFIKRIDDVIEERRNTQRVYNDFESHLYQLKQFYENDENIKKVTKEDEYNNYITEISNNIKWLLSKSHKMPLTGPIITDKWRILNETLQRSLIRAEELPQRNPAFEKLEEKIEECTVAMNVTWPRTRPWMREKEKEKMRMAIDHATKYFQIFKNLQENLTVYDDPKVTAKEINQQTYYLDLQYNFTLRKSENPPTPKPAKTQDPYVKVYNSAEDYEADIEKYREKELFGL